jgi:23S rRNA pseudouridine1911/1915/1917 synthase
VDAAAALTLLDVLRRRFPGASSRTLRQMLAADRVRVNGTAERVAKRPIGPGDRVEVDPRAGRPLDSRLRLLFEDDSLLVVDKTAGLLSVPREAEEEEETAESLLDAYAGGHPGRRRVYHVHRLDRDSSGVLVFARGEYMRDRLQELFAAHDVERIYVAVVHGTPRPPAGTLRCFLAEDRDRRVRRVAGASRGKEAITRYRTLGSDGRFARMEARLETGRRHQIRVQFADAGHPVVGDRVYGRVREDPLGRLALHARHLGFVHPATHRRMAFTVEAPSSFGELIG